MLSESKTVVMLAPQGWPSLGGVQTHLGELSKELTQLGWQVKILVPPTNRPAGKFGLIWLWFWTLGQWPQFSKAQIIQIHDVFLWFWPVWSLIKLQNLFGARPTKIITTFHGWEGTFPPTRWQKFNKWLAQLGSNQTIAVGAFISQFYPIKPKLIVYGGVRPTALVKASRPGRGWIYLGRLDSDTGLPLILQALKTNPIKFEFWGDGNLTQTCAQFGHVLGWVKQPVSALIQLSQPPVALVAGGYLAVLEALSLGLRVVVVADNPLKLVYYQLAPFAKYLTIITSMEELLIEFNRPVKASIDANQAQDIQTTYAWSKLAKDYQEVYEN